MSGHQRFPKTSLNYWMRSAPDIYVPKPELVSRKDQLKQVKRALNELIVLRDDCKSKLAEASQFFREGFANVLETVKSLSAELERSRNALEQSRGRVRALESKSMHSGSQNQQLKVQNNLLQLQNSSLTRQLKALNQSILKLNCFQKIAEPSLSALRRSLEERGVGTDVRGGSDQIRRAMEQIYVQKLQLSYKYQTLTKERDQTAVFMRELQTRVGFLQSQLMSKKLVERQLNDSREKLAGCEMMLAKYADFQQYANEIMAKLAAANSVLKSDLQESGNFVQALSARHREQEQAIAKAKQDMVAQNAHFASELQKQQKRHCDQDEERINQFRNRMARLRDNYEQTLSKQAQTIAQLKCSIDREQEEMRRMGEILKEKDAQLGQAERARQDQSHDKSGLQFRLNELALSESKLKSMLQLQQSQHRQLKQIHQKTVTQYQRLTRAQLIGESSLSNAQNKLSELQRMVAEKSQTIQMMSQSYRREMRQYLSQAEVRRLVAQLQGRLATVGLMVEQGQDWERLKSCVQELINQGEFSSRKELNQLQGFYLRIVERLASELVVIQERQVGLNLQNVKLHERMTQQSIELDFIKRQLGEYVERVKKMEADEVVLKQKLTAERRLHQSNVDTMLQRLRESEAHSRREIQRLESMWKEGSEKAECYLVQVRGKQAEIQGLQRSFDNKCKEARLLFDLVQTLQLKLNDHRKVIAEVEELREQTNRLNSVIGESRKESNRLLQINSQLQDRLQHEQRVSAGLREQAARLQSRLCQLNVEQLRLQAQLQQFVQGPGTHGRRAVRPARQLVKQLKQEYKQKYDQLLKYNGE